MEPIGGETMAGQPCADCTTHQGLAEQVTLNKASCAQAHHRIDEVQAHTESIIRLSMSVEHLTQALINDVIPEQKQQAMRLTVVEQRPGAVALHWWKTIMMIAITALLTGLVGYSLGVLLSDPETVALLGGMYA